MGLPRCLSSPGVGALINICAIFFLVVNMVQNQYSFHDRAVGEHARMNIPGDDDRPPSDVTSIGLFIPRGKAVALPSIRISEDEEKDIDRSIYGGKGDKPHLGGFTEFDVSIFCGELPEFLVGATTSDSAFQNKPLGVSPSLWKHMITHLGIKSLLDVGCGRGISTSWFVLHGLEYVVCVEGSHDAVMQSIVPEREDRVIEHDFSRGPWWPDRTVDAAWAVEFVRARTHFAFMAV
ncbi:hypothetical protein ACHAXA_009102 [Cyclostephanos tholiformis]|uniref:Methyltransferase type 11 domain-containing protein n=1 Tax=Cyclostephanos tholiformis TaxID=382380 RepID=A0ABD3SQL9_9STRA